MQHVWNRLKRAGTRLANLFPERHVVRVMGPLGETEVHLIGGRHTHEQDLSKRSFPGFQSLLKRVPRNAALVGMELGYDKRMLAWFQKRGEPALELEKEHELAQLAQAARERNAKIVFADAKPTPETDEATRYLQALQEKGMAAKARALIEAQKELPHGSPNPLRDALMAHNLEAAVKVLQRHGVTRPVGFIAEKGHVLGIRAYLKAPTLRKEHLKAFKSLSGRKPFLGNKGQGPFIASPSIIKVKRKK